MAEYKLSYTAQEIDEKLGEIDNAVKFVEQSLSDEQKAQARENIGALAKNFGIENAGATLMVGEDGKVTVSAEETVEVETAVPPVLSYTNTAAYVVTSNSKFYYADSEFANVDVYSLEAGKRYRFTATSLKGRSETYATASTLFEKPASGYGSGVAYIDYRTESVDDIYAYELIPATDCYIYVQTSTTTIPSMVVVTKTAALNENDYPMYSVTEDGNGIEISYPYGNDVLKVLLNKRGGNNLFDFRSIKTTTETLFDALLSDWHSPFVVAAVNNIDGDAPDNQYFTGGSHQTNNANSGGAVTARTSMLTFYANGKLLSAGDSGCANKIEMCWTNLVQGYNTSKADGTGREILQENHKLTFINGKFESYVEIIPLEDVVMKTYYGLQGIMTNVYTKIRYLGGTNRSEYTGVSESGDLTTYCMNCYKDKHMMRIEIDPLFDLGKRTDSFVNGTKGAFSVDYGKCYFTIINKNVSMTAKDMYCLRGSYEFTPLS